MDATVIGTPSPAFTATPTDRVRAMIRANVERGFRASDAQLPSGLAATAACTRGWAIHLSLATLASTAAADSWMGGRSLDSVTGGGDGTKRALDRADGLIRDHQPEIWRAVEAAKQEGARNRASDAASYWFPDELGGRETQAIMRPRAALSFTAALPVRSEDPYAEYWRQRTGDISGGVAWRRPGDTEPPTARPAYAERRYAMHTAWSSLVEDFDFGGRAALAGRDPRADDRSAVIRAMGEFAESSLLNGAAGVDFRALPDVGAPLYNSPVNYSTATIGQMYADLIRYIDTARRISGSAVSNGDTLYLAPSTMVRFERTTNLDAGGSANLAGELMAVLRGKGVNRIVIVPGLADYFGAGIDLMLLAHSTGPSAMQQVVGMQPAPVRTVDHLTTTQTLYAMTHGGLSLPVAEGAIRARVQVD